MSQHDADAPRLEREKRLSTTLLKLGRLNRDLLRDRIFRDKERLMKERSDINMLLVLYDAQQRESGALPESELREILRVRGGPGDLDEKEVERLRARRVEIGNLLREVEHVGPDFRELPHERLRELTKERDQLTVKALEVLEDPTYFNHRVKKIRKAVGEGKRDKVIRFLRGLEEQLGKTSVGEAFDALGRLAAGTEEAPPLPHLVALVTRSRSGPFLQAVLSDVGALQRLYPEGWRQVAAAVLENVALFHDVSFDVRSPFWDSPELAHELPWQRLAVQNPSAPAELLQIVLGCPREELVRCRVRAKDSYGSEAALDCLAEVLRDARDPELIAHVLDLVDDAPVLRCRFYYVAKRHAGLPAPLARRILTQGDLSVEDAMDFRRRNPEIARSA